MIKQDDMENMTNKTLKQINTNIVPQNNVPMVPEHLQTQNMMRPVVSPPTLPGVVPPPPPPNANFNPYQGGMGNQMGTYPLAQKKFVETLPVAESTGTENISQSLKADIFHRYPDHKEKVKTEETKRDDLVKSFGTFMNWGDIQKRYAQNKKIGEVKKEGYVTKSLFKP